MKPQSCSQSFHLRTAASEIGVRAMLAELIARLAANEIDAEVSANVELAISEVLNNIVEHACRDQCNGHIELTCRLIPPWLKFEVTDNGVELPGRALPEGARADVNVALTDMPEGGFGWFLIQTLGEGLRYRRIEDCNHLAIAFRIMPQQGQGTSLH